LVLVVFGVMLTAQGPFISIKTGPADWAIGALVGSLLLTFLIGSITLTTWSINEEPIMNDAANSVSSAALGQAFLGINEVAKPGSVTGIRGAPRFVRTRVGYLLPFEIVSVHLLVVLIGAAYLARAKRRRGVTS
jgi:NADH:ubiquinone oxidoreductase subunit 6 (subunit J)